MDIFCFTIIELLDAPKVLKFNVTFYKFLDCIFCFVYQKQFMECCNWRKYKKCANFFEISFVTSFIYFMIAIC